MKIVVATLPEMAELLKAARESKDLLQVDVARAAGKNTATLHYWEGGCTEPGALALARALAFLGLTPNDVLLKGQKHEALKDVPKAHKALTYRLLKAVGPLMESKPAAVEMLCGILERAN